MARIWRLLRLKVHDAFANMAIDEAILTARIEEKVPDTLRLFRWRPSAVSVGRFQDLCKEVNLENCEAQNVDVVRRISGGGAVYHDSEDEITYSVAVSWRHLGVNDVAEAYCLICDSLIEAAQILGVIAEYDRGSYRQCPNLTIGGRKFSGSAQANRRGTILQHGTFLIDVNLEKMFQVLKIPWKCGCLDLVGVANRKITSISQELGRHVSIGEVLDAMKKGFENSLGVRLVEDVLTDYELDLAKRLEEEKFVTSTWNFEGIESAKFRTI